MKAYVRASAPVVLLLALWTFPVPPDLHLCGFHWLTHRPCPFCGLTRALFALARGHWYDATHLHALAPLGMAMLLALSWDHPLRARLWAAGVAAFAIYGVARMAGLLA